MYSKVRDLLKLSQSVSESELCKICNEYYWIYKEIYTTSNNNEIKNIALCRLNSLEDAMKSECIEIDKLVLIDKSGSKVRDVSFVETLFNCKDGQLDKDFISKEIHSLPDCSRKYYLQAVLVHATEAKNLSTYNKMAELLGRALSLDPTNYLYKQILDDVKDAVDKYENDLNEWRRAEQERIDHERRVETTKKVASGVGTVLLAILGALGAAIAGIFACCCESLCDGC